MKYEELLELFNKGEFVDETTFYFSDDKDEMDHTIGYLPQFETPYWAGYCDVEGGCDFKTAEELFTAPIYDGKSIKERYNQLILTAIGGLDLEDLHIVDNEFLRSYYHKRFNSNIVREEE